MVFQFSPYAWLLLGNGVAAAAIAYLAYRRREKYAARWLFWMSIAIAWWSVTYGLHVAGADVATQYFFNRIKYLGAVFASPLWFLLAYTYTHAPQRLSTQKQILVLASTAIFLPLIFLDPVLHTWWPQITPFRFNGALLALKVTHSIYYLIFAVIVFSWTLAGLVLFIRHYIQHPPQRPQIRWLILAGLLPPLGNVITQLGVSPLPWGLDPFLFTFSLLFLAIAILKERFLDPLPIAHRLVIEQLPQGVIVLNTDRVIVDINPAAAALCPSTLANPKGKLLDEAIGNKMLLSHMLFAIYQQPDEPLEISLDTPKRTLIVRATIIQGQEEPRGYLLTINDITRQKHLEEELAKARDMAIVASALKSRLLASATQDIRHPAGMVIGYLESLLQGVYGTLSREQTRAVTQALEQGNQMLGFLSNLMGYAEIESGAMLFKNAPFTPLALIDAVRPRIEAIGKAKNLEILWEIDPALPETLRGDMEWLSRVLANLLNNAISYTSRGRIRTRLYRVDEKHWAMEVEDTGRGISLQQQKRLFDLKHAQGLGLIVARGVVEHMGGELKFTSVVGQGTTFTAILPLQE